MYQILFKEIPSSIESMIFKLRDLQNLNHLIIYFFPNGSESLMEEFLTLFRYDSFLTMMEMMMSA